MRYNMFFFCRGTINTIIIHEKTAHELATISFISVKSWFKVVDKVGATILWSK